MRGIIMREYLNSIPKFSRLVIIGIFFSVLSFVVDYFLKIDIKIINISIYTIDIVLLLLNFYYLSFVVNGKKEKSMLNSFLLSIIYFTALLGVILCFFVDKVNISMILEILKVLVYLSPMIILLLPVIVLLGAIVG